jgi:outer membrane lipoprotein SlyB
MRSLFFLLCVLGLPCVSAAQTNHASWALLNGLQPGQKIQLVDTASKKHTGTFLRVSDTAVSFSESNGEQSIQKQDVRSVKLMKNSHRLRNTAIGLLAGAGVGAAIGAAAFHGCSPQDFFCIGSGGGAAIVGVMGGAAGAVVGALVPSHDTIYDTAPH